MFAQYQKSLRDPNNPYMANHWMNRKLKPITAEIFSQMPTEDTSYALDSFCVADDHVSVNKSKIFVVYIEKKI